MFLSIYDMDRCSDLTIRERLFIYKKVGFTNVSFYYDDEYLNGETKEKFLRIAKNMGLNVSDVHLDYNNSNYLWEDNLFGERYFEYFKSSIEECIKNRIWCVTAHLSKGNDKIKITKIGMTRLKKLDSMLKNTNTFLCFENVRKNEPLYSIFCYKFENIKMCYDSGHAHCYDDEKALLRDFKEKIIVSHLHNNYGKKDTHNELMDGTIDWIDTMRRLDETNRTYDTLEVFPQKGLKLTKKEFEAFVRKNYDSYLQIVKDSRNFNNSARKNNVKK